MKPASSSQAKSVFSSGDSRGTPVKSACERIARRISSLTPRSAKMGSPFVGWSGSTGSISHAITHKRGDGPFLFVLAKFAGIRGDASFHRQRVLTQVFRFREFVQDFQALFPVHSNYDKP